MMRVYTPPALKLNAFNCPHCEAYSQQYWYPLIKRNTYVNSFEIGFCVNCEKITIWKEKSMVYPLQSNTPMPNPDMPDHIKEDYNEARNIVLHSPRSACILLRLCIEKVCNDKQVSGSDLNEKIRKLAEQKLDSEIIKALDSIRVIGGQAAHHLKMDLKDDVGTAASMFEIVNYICTKFYTDAKMIKNIYDSLPDEKKESIKKRDSKLQK